MQTPIETDSRVRIFTTFDRLADGHLLPDLDAAIREVSQAVREAGKRGAITLKITIAPASRGGGEAVNVAAEIKTLAPRPSSPDRLFFVEENGALTVNDPRQRAMFADQPAAE